MNSFRFIVIDGTLRMLLSNHHQSKNLTRQYGSPLAAPTPYAMPLTVVIHSCSINLPPLTLPSSVSRYTGKPSRPPANSNDARYQTSMTSDPDLRKAAEQGTLIGTTEEIIQLLGKLRNGGVEYVFLAGAQMTPPQMRIFAIEIMPAFA